MKNKLAIFDLDGTLFDTSVVNGYAYKKALNEYGYDIDLDYFAKYCNGLHYKTFIGPIVKDDEFLLSLIHQKKKEMYPKYLLYARKNEILFDLINKLKDEYNIALVTTASKENVYQLLECYQCEAHFDLILTQEDVKKKKPDPEGFLKAMDYYKVDAKSTLIFEDAEAGVEAALKTGAFVFQVKHF